MKSSGREWYARALTDQRWADKRREVLERDCGTCFVCGACHGEMDVHHLRYRQGAMPWEYPASELITLCRGCHGGLTSEKAAELKRFLCGVGPEPLPEGEGFRFQWLEEVRERDLEEGDGIIDDSFAWDLDQERIAERRREFRETRGKDLYRAWLKSGWWSRP